MTEQLFKECDIMARNLGYNFGWKEMGTGPRTAVMQLVLLERIGHQLEEIDRSLQSSRS